MATDIKAPSFPESVAEGTVATWHKKVGDSVERDELIVEIETDKVVLEVVAPEAGTLSEIKIEEGDTCESEQVLGVLGAASEGGKSEARSEEKSGGEQKSGGEEKAAAKPAAAGKSFDVKAPSFPESVQEGTVASWNKKVGEAVKRDEVLAEIETDKVVLEVVAPADGALSEIKVQEGEVVESEALLATFSEGAGGEGSGGDSGASAESAGDQDQHAGADQEQGADHGQHR